jgi:Bacterial RNA polymerase, alpha chain C terminal domain
MPADPATPVNELPLSVRSYNCLVNLGIETVGDLLQKTDMDLLRSPNFGRISLREVQDVLEELGYEMPRERPGLAPPKPTDGLPNYLKEEIDRATERFRNKRVEIETRRWQQKQNKALRERRKLTASQQSIATAVNQARYQERDRIMVLLRDAGQQFRWIGRLLGVSGNRVAQVYAKAKRREERAARLAKIAEASKET